MRRPDDICNQFAPLWPDSHHTVVVRRRPRVNLGEDGGGIVAKVGEGEDVCL